jgi:uncharacterized protein YndB with AHSA1/START domain
MNNFIFAFVTALVLAVGIILFLAGRKPGSFRIERSVVVKASPEKIFPLITNFRRWAEWSPFEKLDPNMEKTYSGAQEGKGAIYEWKGGGRAGVGRMEIIEATASKKIVVNLSFSKPMKAQNITEFTLTPSGDVTAVSWEMYGPNSLVAKIYHVFMNMEAMVGKSFDEGLAKLKEIAEKR